MLLLSEGCKDNMVYYVDLQGLPEDGPSGLLSPVCIVDKFEADYEVSPWTPTVPLPQCRLVFFLSRLGGPVSPLSPALRSGRVS